MVNANLQAQVYIECELFTESATRLIQSLSCVVHVMWIWCVSPPSVTGIKRAGEFRSKSVWLKILTIFGNFFLLVLFCSFSWSCLMWIVEELAGKVLWVGLFALVTGDRWQVTGDTWHVTCDFFLLLHLYFVCNWCYYPNMTRDSVALVCQKL